MNDNHKLNHIINEIDLLQNKYNYIFIAIDGYSASGKSTIAKNIYNVKKQISSIIEMDDFYYPLNEQDEINYTPEIGYQKYFDWKRLEKQVLIPLSNKSDTTYQFFDWESDIPRLHKQWKTCQFQKIIIIEGVYSCRPEISKYFNYKIFVDTPETDRLQRITERNHHSSEQNTKWSKSEEWYMKNIFNINNVDAIIKGY